MSPTPESERIQQRESMQVKYLVQLLFGSGRPTQAAIDNHVRATGVLPRTADILTRLYLLVCWNGHVYVNRDEITLRPNPADEDVLNVRVRFGEASEALKRQLLHGIEAIEGQDIQFRESGEAPGEEVVFKLPAGVVKRLRGA